MGLVSAVGRAVWWRWLSFGWIGRVMAIAIAFYAFGWVLGNLGMNTAARSLGEAALYIAAFPITALIIRLVWRDATARHQWPR